jgi:hypothetical protein
MSINWSTSNPDPPPTTAADWNFNCDIIAVALHRAFGLPMAAEFEYGRNENGREILGYLAHAWAVLPDERMLDADGIATAPIPSAHKDPNDDWVLGYRIVSLSEKDPHFVDTRETDPDDPFTLEIEQSRAIEWVVRQFGPALAEIGILPVDAATSYIP